MTTAPYPHLPYTPLAKPADIGSPELPAEIYKSHHIPSDPDPPSVSGNDASPPGVLPCNYSLTFVCIVYAIKRTW